MKDNCGADYVCSNPPYVGEKGHKELFQYYRERFDYWSGHYQGKMDYFYWFVILGLSKLRKGGRLGFITTSYWPTASGAATLRRYILEHAKIIEMIDFGETRIFSDAPGQHNMVFVLERCEDKEERQNHRPVLVRVKQEFEGKSINQKINRLLDHIQEHIDNAPNRKFKDDYISIFPSPIPQKQMEGRPWAITYGESAGVVLHQMEAAGVQLSQVLEINAGVHSNADAVKSTDLSRLRPDQRQGIAEGDGIFILTKEEKNSLQIPDEEKGVVKITYKNSDIAPYIIEPAAPLFMLYIDNSFKPDSYPTILRHLKRFRPILESRLERYGENYSWYRLHRPHQRQHYESEKIVAPRWGKRIDFAYEPGGRYENSDINLFIKRPEVEEDIKYFLALLNSVALAFWREHKGQFKGVTRQSLLKSMPIYRIHFDPSTAEEVKQAKLDKMEECLTGGDCDAAYDILQQALDADQEDIVHDGMMALAGQIIDIKTDLTDYTDYFGTRLTRLSDGDPLPDIAPLALLRELPAEEQWSVYIHIQNGSLTVDENFSGSRDDFYFYRVKKKESDDNSITLREKGRGADTLTLKGNTALISYLKAVLPDQQEQLWREVKQTLVPRDTTVFTDERRRITQEVTAIREQVAGRQSVIDRIVLDLYGITDPDNRKMVLD
jgi:hypothetical protein